MKTKPFIAIVKKEFFSYINSPLAYVVIIPFLLVSNFLFFRTALVIGDANLRPFVELLPWFMIVIGPALAMRSFNEESSKDTLELLFAHPVTEWSITLAKFMGILLFYALILASTLSLPITLMIFSRPDYGLMISQYLGSFLAGATFLAIGMMASAYIKSSVGSFLLGTALSFVLVLVGLNFVTLMFPAPLNVIVGELSVMNHTTSISRGLLDLRDLVYFATVIGLSLTACVVRLSQRKVIESKSQKQKLTITFALILAIGISTNFVLYSQPVRADLTANQRYSMSGGTKKLLKNLPDLVTITYYVSNNLPGPMQLTAKETADRLKDFGRYGGNKIVVKQVVVTTTEQQDAASSAGIQQVSFNQIAKSSYQVQQGYHGLQVRYGEKTEVIPFIEDAGDLEYQLARLILKLTRDEKSKIALFNLTSSGSFNQIQSLISQQYDVSNEYEGEIISDLGQYKAVVVLDDGSQENATTSAQLATYLDKQGNGLFMVDGVSINQQNLDVTTSKSGVISMLNGYGIGIQKNLVYDLQLNEAITLGQGAMRYIVAYPFWIRSLTNKESMLSTSNSGNVLLGWPSSITLAGGDQNKFKASSLFETSTAANSQTSSFTIRPEELKSLSKASGERYTLAAVSGIENQRVVVVANTTFASDDFLQNTPANVSFIANTVDWVAADEILASIPKRTSGRNVFTFANGNQAQIVQYINLLLPPILVGGLGFFWLARRRQLSKRTYISNHATK